MRQSELLAARAAPFWRRFIADILDLALLSTAIWGAWVAGWISPAQMPPQTYDWVDYTAELIGHHGEIFLPAVIVTMTTGLIYGILFHTLFEGTIGERLMGLRLVADDGDLAGPVRALFHGLGTTLGVLILAQGYMWAAVGRRRQGLAEAVSGTVLITGLPEPHQL
ncbi:MAG: RDD family protein [Bradymonadia bacterium]